jgi:LAO/AO transport system kinase
VLDAAGKDVVLIETVGVGQDEVDIVRTADVSIVTLVPGTGDEVQALKAGIMEIADIFVVNKADREGADRTVASIEAMLSLQTFAEGEWRPPIVKTEATTGAACRSCWRRSSGSARTRRRTQGSAAARAPSGAARAARPAVHAARRARCSPRGTRRTLDRIAARETDPYTAVDGILARALGGGSR